MTRTALVGLALISFTFGGSAARQTPRALHGVVFDDANGNEKRDQNETGLPGVVVSDQISVTSTGADGAWKLDAAPSAHGSPSPGPSGWTGLVIDTNRGGP